MDLVGIEPTTSSMPWKRAPSCATGPREKDRKFHEGLTSTILAYWLLIVKPGSEQRHLFRVVHFAKARKLKYADLRLRRPQMKRRSFSNLRYLSLLPLCLAAGAQVVSSNQPAAQPANQGPVSYSSVNQLNGLLSQLEQSSQAAQLDLAKLRIEKWKTDAGTKRQAQGNTESIQRNLQTALPEIIAELRASPENLASTFKLYRNLDALYDVFESVAESAGAFGTKDEFQGLENDVSAFEKSRRAFADRMETLAGAKEVEVTRLRAALQNAQASAPATPPKKIVVDDTTPPKKPVKKKAPPKPAPPATDTPATKPQ